MDLKDFKNIQAYARDNGYDGNADFAHVAKEYELRKKRGGFNKLVPQSVIDDYKVREWELKIERLKKENARLTSENATLRGQLKKREQAINEFKQWQARVAERNYDYWLTKGLTLANREFNSKLVSALCLFLGSEEKYDKRVKKILKAHKAMLLHATNLIAAYNESGEKLSDDE